MKRQEFRPCSVEGCNRQSAAKGYCASHYEQFKRGITDPKDFTPLPNKPVRGGSSSIPVSRTTSRNIGFSLAPAGETRSAAVVAPIGSVYVKDTLANGVYVGNQQSGA